MWIFEQSTGKVFHDEVFDHLAYAGHGEGLDNPAMQNVPDVGPLPAGVYGIGELTNNHLGYHVMELTPRDKSKMFGRGGFWWHGDEIEHPGEHLASDGCIISPLANRLAVGHSGDTLLQVVERLN